MNTAELLKENATLRRALHRPERSRFTKLRADLLRENKEMRAELASYQQPPAAKRPRQTKRPLRTKRIHVEPYVVVEDLSGHSGVPNAFLVAKAVALVNGVRVFQAVDQFGDRTAAIEEARALTWPREKP